MSILGPRVLVVGAHPDDLEMNAGGTIHRLRSIGVDVFTVILAKYSDLGEERLAESEAAQMHLGVADPKAAEGTDTELHLLKSELIDVVDSAVKEVKPTTVISHYWADTHQDHVTAYEVVAAGARNVKNILMFKPTFPSGRTDVPFHPNFISRLSETDMAAKLAAMNEFKTQKKKYGEGLWIEALKSIAIGDAWTYGGFHGFAELFQISRLSV